VYGSGETIVRQGDPGQSMFVIASGAVSIVLEPSRQEVARTPAGGYFGEMSLLTGDPRTATVIARGDCVVLEISADAFRHYVQSRPEVIEPLANAAAARRKELDQSRATGAAHASITPISLAERMRRFFGLS
jgi:CRP-like cAMP-binding protein